MYNLVALITFPILFNYHCCFQNSFIMPNRKSVTIKQQLHTLPFPQPLVASDLLSISKNLPVLDISYKLNNTICPLCLAYFTFS